MDPESQAFSHEGNIVLLTCNRGRAHENRPESRLVKLRAMRPALLILVVTFLASCSQPASEASKEPPKQYKMHGEVTRVDPQNKLATIDAQKVDGWMEAMKMDYPVKDQQDLSKLQAGECIDATVFVQGNDFWVADVKPTTAAPGTCVPPKTPPDGK